MTPETISLISAVIAALSLFVSWKAYTRDRKTQLRAEIKAGTAYYEFHPIEQKQSLSPNWLDRSARAPRLWIHLRCLTLGLEMTNGAEARCRFPKFLRKHIYDHALNLRQRRAAHKSGPKSGSQ